MARWTAKCWLGSKSGYQNCEVNANTISGAEEQLRRIYGAEQIINLSEVRNKSSVSESSSSSESFLGLLLVALLFFIIAYWKIIVPIVIIILSISTIVWFRR